MTEIILKNGKSITPVTVTLETAMRKEAREKGLNLSKILRNAVKTELMGEI